MINDDALKYYSCWRREAHRHTYMCMHNSTVPGRISWCRCRCAQHTRNKRKEEGLWCTGAHETIILQRQWCCGTEYDTPYAKTVNVFKYECTIQNFGVCPIALMYIRIYCFYCSWVVVIGESSGIFQGRTSTALKVGTYSEKNRDPTNLGSARIPYHLPTSLQKW